jgi:hypothetical protein
LENSICFSIRENRLINIAFPKGMKLCLNLKYLLQSPKANMTMSKIDQAFHIPPFLNPIFKIFGSRQPILSKGAPADS